VSITDGLTNLLKLTHQYKEKGYTDKNIIQTTAIKTKQASAYLLEE